MTTIWVALRSSLAALLLCMAGPAVAAEAPAEAARAVLEAQRDAWSRGDLDAFMRGYWRDDALRFAGGGAFRHGWQATLERYRATYPDRAAMGRLEFDLVEVREPAPDVVYVFGRWRLALESVAASAAGSAPHGLFTLLVERKDGAWVVTRDHTSSAGER